MHFNGKFEALDIRSTISYWSNFIKTIFWLVAKKRPTNGLNVLLKKINSKIMAYFVTSVSVAQWLARCTCKHWTRHRGFESRPGNSIIFFLDFIFFNFTKMAGGPFFQAQSKNGFSKAWSVWNCGSYIKRLDFHIKMHHPTTDVPACRQKPISAHQLGS